MKKYSIFYTTYLLSTYSRGIVSCPIELLEEKLSEDGFVRYANGKMDSLEQMLSKNKKVTLRDVTGKLITLYDKDIYMLNVSTVQMICDESKPSKGVAVIPLNHDEIG